MNTAPYGCGECGTQHDSFHAAAECCKADYVVCPLTELPEDAKLSNPGEGRYTYGKGSFISGWSIVDNESPLPTRVYSLPALMCQLLDGMIEYGDLQFERGRLTAQREMRRALGLKD